MADDGRQRIVITVRPQPSDDGLLTVTDALQQVIDLLKVVEAASRDVTSDPQTSFDWRLEKASTNSPFTVVAVAQARNPSVNVLDYVVKAKYQAAQALRMIDQRVAVPPWLNKEARGALQSLYQRNLNGVSETSIEFADSSPAVNITKKSASIALEALKDASPFDDITLQPRTAFGEIDGRLIAVGRWKQRPALTIVSPLYGAVICVVPMALVTKMGGHTTLEDVWKGRSVAVNGRLLYARGGSLSRVVVETIRERVSPVIDIMDVIDPEFTSGLDPVEYINALHGETDA